MTELAGILGDFLKKVKWTQVLECLKFL